MRRIWDPQPDRPLVCHEEYWERWQRHQVAPVCWPVSREQLYGFDEGLAQQLAEAYEGAASSDARAAALLEQLWSGAARLE